MKGEDLILDYLSGGSINQNSGVVGQKAKVSARCQEPQEM